MKILFFMRYYSYIAHYDESLRILADRGHQIHFTFMQLKSKPFDDARMKRHFAIPGVTYDFFPDTSAGWVWADLAVAVRRLIDWLRYLHPDYKSAGKLRRRHERKVPPVLRAWFERFLLKVAGPEFWIRRLRGIERSIPVSGAALDYLKRRQPDLVLFTPLLDSNTGFIDYAKAAEALGIPRMICVASWDNLTNKGLIQSDVERVMVWNEFQKAEAVKYHGCQASRVVVTGAQTFDKWFDRRPSLSKEDFLRKTGLGACPDLLVYTCSSGFIAANEIGFLRKWLEAVRADRSMDRFGLMVRPHPANPQKWDELGLERFPNAVVYPRWEGLPYPFSQEDKEDYFHSLHHASAVVGINTSAMIEAGIQTRPVFTVLAEDFKETQEGTLHFFHMTDRGLLYVAHDLDEHIRQLKEALADGSAVSERIRSFIRDFVRPHGLERPCTPYVVEAIEGLPAVCERGKTLRSGAGRAGWSRGFWYAVARLANSLSSTHRRKKPRTMSGRSSGNGYWKPWVKKMNKMKARRRSS